MRDTSAMRTLLLALIFAMMAVIGQNSARADPCQVKTVRTIQGKTICIYNCAGRTKTATSAGNFCPVILE